MCIKKLISICLALCLVFLCTSCTQNKIKNTPVAAESSSDVNSVPDTVQDESKSNFKSEAESNSTTDAESVKKIESAPNSTTETESIKEQTTSHKHKWQEKKISPTCTQKGYTIKSCNCGQSSKSNYTDALGHSWSKWKTVKAATTNTTGTKQRTCSRCGKTQTDTIPKITMTTSQKQTEVWKIVNKERSKEGLAPLSYRSDLQALADKRAAEIAEKFSHTRPDGRNCFTVFDDYGYGNSFGSLGENIAYGYFSPEEVMNGWMNSSGHRANILGDFNGIIVGVYEDCWVQLFVYE